MWTSLVIFGRTRPENSGADYMLALLNDKAVQSRPNRE